MVSKTNASVLDIDDPTQYHEISPHLTGFNNQWQGKDRVWKQDAMRDLFQQSYSSTLRYPGGTVSSYWDFDNDTFFTPKELDLERVKWVKPLVQQGGQDRIEDIARLQQDMGNDLAIVFVANMVTPQATPAPPPRSVAWYAELEERYQRFTRALDRAKAKGIPIQYIELGNEYYFSDSYIGANKACPECGGQSAFPEAGDSYADAANYFARKLKERYPGVKIAAIGTAPKGNHDKRHRQWNNKVVPGFDRSVIDAITAHVYHSTTGNPATERGLGQTISSWNNRWKNRLQGGRGRARVPAKRGEINDWDIWFTEFGAFGTDFDNHWQYAFYISNALDQWLQQTRIQMAQVHIWRESFNPDGTLKANARAISMWSLASRGHTSAGRLEIANVPKIQGTEHDGVIGWIFKGDQGESILLVNYTSNPHELDLAEVDDLEETGSSQFTIHTAAAENLATGPAAPDIVTTKSNDKQLILPPYSLVVVD